MAESAFIKGMALGQSAYNAQLDVRMNQVREQRMREEMAFAERVRQQKLAAELKSNNSLTAIAADLEAASQKPGGLTNDDILGTMSRNGKDLSPTDAQKLDMITKLYQQTESYKQTAQERIRRQEMGNRYREVFSTELPRDPATGETDWTAVGQSLRLEKVAEEMNMSGEIIKFDPKTKAPDVDSIRAWAQERAKKKEDAYFNAPQRVAIDLSRATADYYDALADPAKRTNKDVMRVLEQQMKGYQMLADAYGIPYVKGPVTTKPPGTESPPPPPPAGNPRAGKFSIEQIGD